MNQYETRVFFAILRSSIDGNKIDSEEQRGYSHEVLTEMLELSNKHDVIHLLARGLKHNNLMTGDQQDFEKYILKAIYRYERQRYEYNNLCNVLEKLQVQFIPLKGAVIRKYYPEEWMRTSCDIDILVHEEDCEKVKTALVENHGYKYHEKGAHDLSFFAPTGVHIELHYDLVEDGRVKESSKVLRNVWNTSTPHDGFEYWLEMSEEMYYYYHIAHMAKHFEDGGCGIRPFIDLWILDSVQSSKKEAINELLEQGQLFKFAESVRKLSRIWFSNEQYDSVSKQMEDYIIRGGVYGNAENRIMIHQQRKGGRIKYALSKIFVPYDTIKFHYPILQKHRWLTPVMEVRRWCKLVFCGHLRRSVKELKYSNNLTAGEAITTQKFLSDIGL